MSNEQVAPEKIWLQSHRTSEGYYVTGASTDLGVVEYIRLDLHTAALVEKERQILKIVALKAPDGDCFCAAIPRKDQTHSARCEYVRERLEAARTSEKGK